ncbi:Ubiquitin-conjugating enzyme E2, partial [Trichinella spiralis]
LANIFESFLPQLLAYPNPTDPLNGDAASLYLHKPEEFKKKCRDFVSKYASEDALRKYCPETDGQGSSTSRQRDCCDDRRNPRHGTLAQCGDAVRLAGVGGSLSSLIVCVCVCVIRMKLAIIHHHHHHHHQPSLSHCFCPVTTGENINQKKNRKNPVLAFFHFLFSTPSSDCDSELTTMLLP